MKKKVTDIIKDILEENGIKHCFTLVGGGAMHLNDSFGHAEQLKCVYFLHEQGAALAAEAYARVNGRMPVVCVTTGPGGTNALTGILCAWQDNIPMLVISGQVKTTTTVKSTGLKLRQLGDQEHTIVDSVRSMTKFAITVEDPNKIKYYVKKAIYIANSGRRGPCLLDIPLDIQGAFIETDGLEDFVPDDSRRTFDADAVLTALCNSKRPVVLAGSGIWSSGAHQQFIAFCEKIGVPVLAAKSVADILPVGADNYYGNFGVNGGRAGNFIVQNADCLLVLGCRLSFGQIGFNYTMFSPNSTKIAVEVDPEELKKDTVKVDIPVNIDLKQFFQWFDTQHIKLEMDPNWTLYCNELRELFPIYQKKFFDRKHVNAYYFAVTLQKYMHPDGICVVGNSCSSVSIKQCGVARPGQRMWGNINCGTMGYDIPAAIGAAIASDRQVICCAGDGSFQLNIQELQTVVNYRLPIKFFVFNNGGYRSIVLSQSKNFNRLSGCTPESGLRLPDLKKIAAVYDIPYTSCKRNEDLEKVIQNVLTQSNSVICEIIEDEDHAIEPKLGSRVLDDGQIVSPTLIDMLPELDKEIFDKYSDYQIYMEG